MKIKQLSEKYNDYIIEQRRWFHQHPELSLHEENTTNAIVEQLTEIGIPVSRFDGIPGCVGELTGGKPGKTVLLRADIDALTVSEQTGLPFASENEGKMHACGHDCHIAMLLGAARILYEMREELSGKVKFLFQSAEELAVGAKMTIEQGVMKDVDACFGMHIWSQMDSPKFNIEIGERMASCDKFTLTVLGKGAHGAEPHQGHDAIVAAAAVVMNLQAVVSRINNPLNALVVSIGSMNGGKRFNIIADNVEMFGTVRTFSREFQNTVEGLIREIAENTAKCYGCTVDLNYEYLTFPVINSSAELVNLCRKGAVGLFGEDILVPLEKMTGSEDFSYFTEKAPGIYGYLGARSPKVPGSELSNHHEKFTVDEDALHHGAAITAQFAYDFLIDTTKQ